MKAKLTFDLDNLDDVVAHNRCVKSLDMASVLFQIAANLRKQCEHTCENMTNSDQFDGVELVFSEIDKLLEEYNIDIDDLIR